MLKYIFSYLLLPAIIILPAIGVTDSFLPHFTWVYEPLHSAMEGIGGLIAIAIAIVLFLSSRRQSSQSNYYWIALGFLGMGVVSCFYSVSVPGHGFVVLYLSANLIGGSGFALSWLKPSGLATRLKRYLFWGVITASIFFSIYVLLFRETLPAMTQNGEFTPIAITLSMIAGALFIIGAVRLLVEFHKFHNTQSYIFSLIGLAMGTSLIVFKYSGTWDNVWWLWHSMRFISCVIAALYLLTDYYSSERELRRTEE